MLPVMGITEAYVLLLLCLYLGVSLTENASPIYNYLDNELYSMPVLPRQGSQLGLGGYDPRFPPPPLFPPPPPSWESDTNKLLREVIFNNILEKIKKGIKGELQEEEDNSIEKDPNEEVKHKGSTLLPTDIPGCGDFPPPENSSKPGNPSTSSLVQGLPGPVGPKGEPGTQGRRGRRGREGPIGPEGRAGSPGIRGPPGLPGPAGVSGLAGRDGQTGIRGPEGPRGPRGRTGFPGSIGPPGKPGPRGEDGIPGLVIFQNAAAMYGVQLEGLIAYRADTKQIYFRDHVTWRAIRVTRCGDGIVDHDLGEECDDANDNPTDSCVGCRRSFCGDGFLHIGQEECDGRNFGGRSCASWRPGMLGILQCNHRCLISYSRCRFPRRFAENEIDKTILPRG